MIDFAKGLMLLEKIDGGYRRYRKMIDEALILEGDSRLKAVERIIEQAFSRYMDVNATVNDSEYYVNGNPDTTWKEYILYDLRHTFGLMQNSDVKYLPLVARLAYSDEVKFDIDNDNGDEIRTLQRIVAQIKKDDSLFEELKKNPSVTFTQLAERFGSVFREEDAADSEAANSVSGGKSDYTVKEVTDFRTAKYYGDRSCSSSQLCYTQSEKTWLRYSFAKRVYVCLRNGWENIPEKVTEGNPYDLYGTSMIFVFINESGDISTSNCRWNHRAVGEYDGDVDHAFTKATLSQTIGMPFDSVFKPAENKAIDWKAEIESGGGNLSDFIHGDFVIPEGVTVIGESAFNNCTGLTSVTVPGTVYKMNYGAFANCENLSKVELSRGLTSIGEWAFFGCMSMESIEIPDTVTSIEDHAFEDCYALRSIVIPYGVTEIADNAFYCCSALESIVLPETVTVIGDSAFLNCKNLTSITLPAEIKRIRYNAFYNCEQLTVYVKSATAARLVRKSSFNGIIKVVR